MPTYEYRCEDCGRTFDYFQSMNDPRLETCQFDDCEGKVKRLLGTGAGIIFKGSGFYETDYRSDSYKKGAESAKDGDSTTKKSDSGDSNGGSKKESSGSSSSGSSSSDSGSGSGSKSSSSSSSTTTTASSSTSS